MVGKEFNFGLLEFYRLKKMHPDFYDYIPNVRSRKRFQELDFYSSGLYSNTTQDLINQQSNHSSNYYPKGIKSANMQEPMEISPRLLSMRIGK